MHYVQTLSVANEYISIQIYIIFSDTVAFHAVIAESMTIEYDTTVIFTDVLTNSGNR